MNETATKLKELYGRIPRRHTADNVKEMYSLLDEYEDLLQTIEAENEHYEKQVPPFFDAVEPIRLLIKKSNDGKASKKLKDDLFDEGSGNLKNNIQELTAMYEVGQ